MDFIIISINCSISCSGLYADVEFLSDEFSHIKTKGIKRDMDKLARLTKEYNEFKATFVQNILFNPDSPSYGKKVDRTHTFFLCLFTVARKPYHLLQPVHIFFDTATFDTVERDEKITLESQLGVIGGTLGLFTGFSLSRFTLIFILIISFCSAVEIVQFLVKFLFATLNRRK